MGTEPGSGRGADEETGRRLRESVRELELFRWLGFDLETVEPGRVVFRVPFDEKYVNVASGTMHGGVTATAIDTASAYALRTTMDEANDASLTTTDLNVRYVRPARDDVRVDAEVVRAGRTMGVTECTVTTRHDGEEKVVATGGTTYRLFRGDS